METNCMERLRYLGLFLVVFLISIHLASAATVITDIRINTDNVNATNYTLDQDDIPSLSSSWPNTLDAERLVGIDALSGKIVIYQANITDGITIPAPNISAGTFSGAFDFANALTIGGGFGNGGVSISDGSVWIAGTLYVMGNVTNINVTNLNTNGSVIPTVTGTFDLGDSARAWRNLYITNITATNYGLEENDIPSLTSSWSDTLDADRLVGLDYLNYELLIYQSNITDGITIPQANISDGITIPSSNVTAGTFASGDFVFPANLQVSQNFTVSNNVFLVDNDTGRIGIGTRTPTQALTIIGNLNVTGYSIFGSQNFTSIDASGNLVISRRNSPKAEWRPNTNTSFVGDGVGRDFGLFR